MIMLFLAVIINNPHLGQSFYPLFYHQVFVEQFKSLQQYIFTIGQNIHPGIFSSICYRSFHQLEILGIPVGTDVEIITKMVNAVFMISLSR